MDSKFSFSDKKIRKSILSLKYLAYIFMAIVVVLGFGLSTYEGIKIIESTPVHTLMIVLWLLVYYTSSILVILGIKDVINLLTNLENDNIFTYENSNILKKIDNKLVISLVFSIIINFIFALLNFHTFSLLIAWILYIGFLLVGHVLVNPLQLLVEKSAEMQIELDLTI